MTLRRSDFAYVLPPELIAQAPPAERAGGRLLVLDPAAGTRRDSRVRDLAAELRPGDLLVFNDTRVIPARLHGRKDTGGAVEILVERLEGARAALAQVRASKTPKPGSRLLVGDAALTVLGREGEFFRLELAGEGTLDELLQREGAMPLPPYIERAAVDTDRERYQTVFAREPGAVAAPTAGLHFDEALLAQIAARGIGSARVTLHVGAGTFQPMRADDIAQHRMHRERLEVPAATCAAITETRARGGRVVAVGTTVVRSLETAALGGELRPCNGETDIFITPGFRFRVVDALLTNFHLPESTLLMLVSAFAGHAFTLESYRHAVAQRYRFFSYGDAMFIAARAALVLY